MLKILVVEDNQDFSEGACQFLKRHGFDVKGAPDANKAYDLMYVNQFDLVISDMTIPGIDGFEFVESVRKLNTDIPIMLISDRDDLESKQLGYEAGIDDYMTKPINFEEMLLHIWALFRRAKIDENQRVTMGKFVLDMDEHMAYNDGEPIELTVREFNLVFKLLSYPKRIFTREQLMDEFWEANTETTIRTVDVYMTKIREKLADVDCFHIATVRGLGYKAVPNEVKMSQQM